MELIENITKKEAFHGRLIEEIHVGIMGLAALD